MTRWSARSVEHAMKMERRAIGPEFFQIQACHPSAIGRNTRLHTYHTALGAAAVSVDLAKRPCPGRLDEFFAESIIARVHLDYCFFTVDDVDGNNAPCRTKLTTLVLK